MPGIDAVDAHGAASLTVAHDAVAPVAAVFILSKSLPVSYQIVPLTSVVGAELLVMIVAAS